MHGFFKRTLTVDVSNRSSQVEELSDRILLINEGKNVLFRPI